MYFAALLARTAEGWEASDTELDDVETLTDLIELARLASKDDDTVLAFIEHEDAWFGVVRVDGEDDPHIYVSDAAAAARTSYGSMLTDELLGRDPDDDLDSLVDLDGTEDGEPDREDEDADDAPVPLGPLGDADILADYGMDEKELKSLDGDALESIAEMLGCSMEGLEAVR
ncbi:putative tRNA adenosine deaminase-associated protein [Streptomyces melanosporofaciens]|uniref:Putative tRNA adenosine deaminase-associated protein n=1 Tax=Streptomyces melanosporofaciens TaxID=67327 RepID=A0A1H4QIR3_STRMJ|nr:putative tRNA adenosine deaminase-associated protein [Streptomyces melanosporofaciens]